MNTSETFTSIESAESQKQIPNLRQIGVQKYLSLQKEERSKLAKKCTENVFDALADKIAANPEESNAIRIPLKIMGGRTNWA